MRRFRWRLETVLTVALGRERSLRMDLLRLAAEASRLRQEILTRQQTLREAFVELGRQSLVERLASHQVMLACLEAARRHIQNLQGRLQDVQARREKKMAEFLAHRARRKTLERLKEEAFAKYRKEWDAMEQKLTDEAASVRAAQRILSGRVAV